MVSRVATKALTLGERNLDQALLETGMSAEEIERLTPASEEDYFLRSICAAGYHRGVRFRGDGLVPVKTFEALTTTRGTRRSGSWRW